MAACVLVAVSAANLETSAVGKSNDLHLWQTGVCADSLADRPMSTQMLLFCQLISYANWYISKSCIDNFYLSMDQLKRYLRRCLRVFVKPTAMPCNCTIIAQTKIAFRG